MSFMISSPNLRSTTGDKSPRAESPSIGKVVLSGALTNGVVAGAAENVGEGEANAADADMKATAIRRDSRRRGNSAGRWIDFTML
ncbi:hypothetical protein [Massilia horti]|uniref:hypothetical protein n=1 Tax=Massilia horti TaxID=2562153 RepID=UPI001E49433A|nr:hypothetical protein [Massilia horti]